jgi:hypothetical protein
LAFGGAFEDEKGTFCFFKNKVACPLFQPYVFDETVRDYRDDLALSRSDVIPIDTALDRASAHEALHRFVGNHIRPIPTPPGPADEGIMQNALVVFTTANDFTLTDAQIRAVQRLRNPK